MKKLIMLKRKKESVKNIYLIHSMIEEEFQREENSFFFFVEHISACIS